jgi:excinuclease UvrABC nuclease subunit
MSLKEQISEDMKTAMRAKDSERLATIRLLMAAIKQREVDDRVTLDDAGITAVIDKMIKQRKDSISQFEAAGRAISSRRNKPSSTCWAPTCPRSCRTPRWPPKCRPPSPPRAQPARRTWAR